MINKGQGVRDPYFKVGLRLFDHVHRMRFGNASVGDPFEFRYPAPDKSALRILVSRLFGWRVDSDRVNSCDAALHLQLVVVNPGFVIEKLLRKVFTGQLPG